MIANNNMDRLHTNVLLKTMGYGFVWPILFYGLLYKFIERPAEIMFFLGALISLPIAFIFDVDGYTLMQLCALPGSIIIFSPLLFFIKKRKEYKIIYIICSLYSFLSSVVGATIILGKFY